MGLLGFDDVARQYNTQEGSQWDGLGHVGNLTLKAFYNGVKNDQIKAGRATSSAFTNGPTSFVGRGVLVDAFRYRSEKGKPINPLTTEKYSLDDLKEALVAQNTELKPGSILLMRTGWMQAYLAARPRTRPRWRRLRSSRPVASTTAARWWHGYGTTAIAAIGTDCPAVEPWPWDFKNEGALHYRTLCLLGLPIGEQFNLEKLAVDCAADKRYECMLVSVPINLEGGIASPPKRRRDQIARLSRAGNVGASRRSCGWRTAFSHQG